MPIAQTPLLTSQRISQICLYLIAAIATFSGIFQMIVGQPETTQRLDNIHRSMAGVYFSAGLMGFWTAFTIHKHDALIYFLALAVFLGGCGRLISMSKVGLPEPGGLWIGYVLAELILPIVMVSAHLFTTLKSWSHNT